MGILVLVLDLVGWRWSKEFELISLIGLFPGGNLVISMTFNRIALDLLQL